MRYISYDFCLVSVGKFKLCQASKVSYEATTREQLDYAQLVIEREYYVTFISYIWMEYKLERLSIKF